MYIEAVIIGMIIGFIRKGRLLYFFEVKYKGFYLVILSLLFFLVPFALKYFGNSSINAAIFPFVSLILCLVVALMNHRRRGMKLLVLGLFINIAVMGLNQYRIPIDTGKMEELGRTEFVESMSRGEIVNYVGLEGTEKISHLLGKVIKMPAFYPLSTVISVGDIISFIAIILVIQDSMILHTKNDMMQFTFTPKYK